MTGWKGKRWLRAALWAAGATMVLACTLAVLAVVGLRSDWFEERVRRRVIAETERATGGRAEVGGVRVRWQDLQAEVTGFVLHGREAAGEQPLVRVERIQLGLHVLSWWAREVDLASLIVEKPRVRVVFYPDGSNNVPRPKGPRTAGPGWAAQLVALKVKRFAVQDGTVEYDGRRLRLAIRGEHLNASLGWEAAGPRYRGRVTASRVRVESPRLLPLDWDCAAEVSFVKEGLEIHQARLNMARSHVTASGWIRDWKSPRLEVDTTAHAALADLVRPLRLPVEPEGTADFRGHVRLKGGMEPLIRGRLDVARARVRRGGVDISGIRLAGDATLTGDRLAVDNVRVSALDGEFRGHVRSERLERWTVEGRLDGLSLAQAVSAQPGRAALPWSATVSGPVKVAGSVGAMTVEARLEVAPREGGRPLEGMVDFRFEQSGGRLSLGNTRLKTPATLVTVSGEAGGRLRVQVSTRDLNDFLPAVALADGSAPATLPVKLDDGAAQFEGQVAGPLDRPVVNGRLAATGVVYEQRKVDRLSAGISLQYGRLALTGLRAEQNGLRVEGTGEIGLAGWKAGPESAVQSRLKITGASLARLLQESDQSVPAQGTLSGTVTIGGTVAKPVVEAQAVVEKLALYEESVDRLTLAGSLAPGLIEITSGEAVKGSAHLSFTGRYEHPAGDYRSGRIRLTAQAKGARLSDVAWLRRVQPGLAGRVEGSLAGTLQVSNATPALESIQGQVAISELSIDARPLGTLKLDARSRGNLVTVQLGGDLRGAALRGSGEWQLTGDHPGLGQVDIGPLALATLMEFVSPAGKPRELPFAGMLSGNAVVAGSLRKPASLRARVELPRLELKPKTDRPRIGNVRAEDLVLRNERPLVFEIDSRGVHVQQAKLVGKDTNLEVSGLFSSQARNPWNLQVRGGLNLIVLQEFFPGLTASGNAILNATVRGTLAAPQVSGRMELAKASAYYRGIPNGIDEAGGVVLFDRNRAVLQNLKAQTGGGDVTLNGFVAFEEEEEIVYRVQMEAERVRVRYPEGASTTVNASLNLSGNGPRNVVTGVLTILRSGFTPRTDIASLLLAPPRPVAAPESSNPFLAGMQFDVRVVNAPNLQLETSLTQGIQAEVELRLRGSPAKPVLLGHVSANQGEINFFGNKYTITRGEVSFFNPARIEPVVDLDLETRIRAVTVNLNVSGPLSKLNVTYRSDPPLQSGEIIALLAVGRAPASSLASSSTVSTQGAFEAGGANTLLGQAVAAGVSGRLQKLFGVSRLKIDPQLTGLDTTPQPRLTVEQQISREITITYVTNLTGTQQQLLRLQWDFRRDWSVLAVRDENGLFGLNIQYQKRFK